MGLGIDLLVRAANKPKEVGREPNMILSLSLYLECFHQNASREYPFQESKDFCLFFFFTKISEVPKTVPDQ